jgi:hypothetical protein
MSASCSFLGVRSIVELGKAQLNWTKAEIEQAAPSLIAKPSYPS